MKYRNWFATRVMWGLVAFLILVWLWEFNWKPQYRPVYEEGINYYQKGEYLQALYKFQEANDRARNAMDVIVMLGWTNLKLNRWEEARYFFDRAIKIDPRTEEAQLGLAFVALETGRGKIDIDTLNRLMSQRQGDPNLRVLVAGAFRREGNNLEAAEMYRGLLGDKFYGYAARVALDEMYGLTGFTGDSPTPLANVGRPLQTQFLSRAADGAMWRRAAVDQPWQQEYIAGVNLGPAAPGYHVGAPPTDGALYADWLQRTAQMNANVIRAYTLLPPAFYRAFDHHVRGGGKVKLYQQIWVGDPPNKDLYDSTFVEETQAEIRHVVDVLHGRGNVPPRRARGSGIYNLPIAEHVSAILLGRELEASVAIRTNVINAGKSEYKGKYISVANANATEVWFAEMLDYLVNYQTETYNWQHPVAVVNWPPLDPLTHPTEASILEEVRTRIRRGEPLALPKDVEDDNDTVAIDEAKFTVSSEFQAGLFASYHVYPYYPDFLLHDPRYLRARDSEGLNPMYGYLRELKARIPYPLVVTEYGIPNSMGISHFHPYGWHHGGHNEQQQAEILARLTRSIRESGAAGGVVFALVDEWYKHNWLARDFEEPQERSPLWVNDMDPEQRYGVIGFQTSKWRLFAGDAAAWDKEPKESLLYSGSGAAADPQDGARQVRSVHAAADEGYLYLRLKLACADCTGPAKRPDGKPDFDRAAYAIAINTLPGLSGIRALPFGGVRLESGANFLLHLTEPSASRMLIAENYNPYQIRPKEGVPGETELSYRRGMSTAMDDAGNFNELVVETNRQRYGRDGSMFRGNRYSRSVLRYGNGDPAAADYDSLAEWFVDVKNNAVLVRLPWGKLLVTDPSGRRVFVGIDDNLRIRTASMAGAEISVFALKPGSSPENLRAVSVAAMFPPPAGGSIKGPKRFVWQTWETVKPDSHLKKAYYALQKEFAIQTRVQPAANAPRPGARRAGAGAVGSR